MLKHSYFIDNKYFRLYQKILHNCVISPNEYCESHHIIPRSLGGSNDQSNIKLIPARVHYLCHYLLTKFTTGQAQFAMAKAFNMMHTKSSSNEARYTNSRLYAANRKLFREAMSVCQSGSKNSQFATTWMTNQITGVSKRIKLCSLEEAVNQYWTVGRKNKQFLTKISESVKTVHTKIKSGELKECNRTKLGLTVLIHRDGEIIKTSMLYYYQDYLLDGFKLLKTVGKNKNKSSTYGRVRITNITSLENLSVEKHVVADFISSGKWRLGMHSPNHKGASKKRRSK